MILEQTRPLLLLFRQEQLLVASFSSPSVRHHRHLIIVVRKMKRKAIFHHPHSFSAVFLSSFLMGKLLSLNHAYITKNYRSWIELNRHLHTRLLAVLPLLHRK
jgi:hypothetical protein